MSEEEKSNFENAATDQSAEEPIGAEHTTAPNPPHRPVSGASQKWEMPKPVYQKTSGYLPQGYVKEVSTGANNDPSYSPQDSTPAPSAGKGKEPDLSAVNLSPTAVDVEPQPDLSEQLIPEGPTPNIGPQTAAKSTGMGIPLVVVGLVVVMIFVAVFLAVIYFLFFAGPGEVNNF